MPLIPAGLWWLWWLWWHLPNKYAAALRIRDVKARADVEDNLRKTIGQLLGGIAVLLGVCVAYLQFLAQQKMLQNQVQSSRDLLIINQVSKGFEQLSNDKMAMRLGGIYALEAAMNADWRYHQPILEALCAYVRDTVGQDAVIGNSPASDIQTIITVIGRRQTRFYLGPLEINDSELYSRSFNKSDHGTEQFSLNLEGARIHGIKVSYVNLRDAVLKSVDLSKASLEGSSLISADLRSANLSGANMRMVRFADANMEGADLRDADLSNADLENVNLKGADLRGAKLLDADITNVSIDEKTKIDGASQIEGACSDSQSLANLHLKVCRRY